MKNSTGSTKNGRGCLLNLKGNLHLLTTHPLCVMLPALPSRAVDGILAVAFPGGVYTCVPADGSLVDYRLSRKTACNRGCSALAYGQVGRPQKSSPQECTRFLL